MLHLSKGVCIGKGIQIYKLRTHKKRKKEEENNRDANFIS